MVALTPMKTQACPSTMRVEDLLAQMTLEEKAGLMFHSMMPMGSTPMACRIARDGPLLARCPQKPVIAQQHLNHFNVLDSPCAAPDSANGTTGLQKLAEENAPGHSGDHFVLTRAMPLANNPPTSFGAGAFSQWPEPIGLAAIGDAALVEAVWRHRPPGISWRWAFAWRCTPWPTWPPSRAGRASTAPLARMPSSARAHDRRLYPRLSGRGSSARTAWPA